ncbi:MAG: carboxypeptidase-like regulatory domain-containing protein [Bacteroidia bacterium]|nr:carboxypeptidase-like regulatory domain-containing protein [Bacteroidia bacterium]
MKKLFLVLVLSLAFASAEAQQRKISGVVKSTDGETIPGANVIIVGTKIATVTDIDGKFNITVPEKALSMVVSYISYVTKIVNLEKKVFFDVVLENDTKTLEDAVVIGYGIQKRANLTGAVGMIDAATIESKPITSASQS